MIAVIARREATSLFRTPLAWTLLGAAQFILAYQFLSRIELFATYAERLRALPEAPGITEIVVTPIFLTTALLYLFLVPIITMSSLAGERRNATLSLLYSAPVSSIQIVLGKFCGLCAPLCLLAVVASLMSATLFWGAAVDLSVILSGFAALCLLLIAYTAVGLMCSALVSEPALAAVLSFTVLCALWLMDWASRVGQDAGAVGALSSLKHFQQLASGLLTNGAVIYFVTLTLIALAITVWRLDGDRRPI